ncbi:Uncharacterized protein Fot_49381 [Forsythia ovata]|uniref:Uncharacterized protein n=1 Tax=Forsythia ovata TaxID=205694 RepID=A0ABD1QBP9_9LAMI
MCANRRRYGDGFDVWGFNLCVVCGGSDNVRELEMMVRWRVRWWRQKALVAAASMVVVEDKWSSVSVKIKYSSNFETNNTTTLQNRVRASKQIGIPAALVAQHVKVGPRSALASGGAHLQGPMAGKANKRVGPFVFIKYMGLWLHESRSTVSIGKTLAEYSLHESSSLQVKRRSSDSSDILKDMKKKKKKKYPMKGLQLKGWLLNKYWNKRFQWKSLVGLSDYSSGVTGPEEHLRSGLVTPGNHVADPLANVPTILDNTGKLNIFEPKVESYADGKRTPKDCDEKVPVCDSCGMNALNTKASVGVVIAAPSRVDASSIEKVNGVEYFAAENIKEMSQRLYVSQIRPRDLSSSNELTGGNKRQKDYV